MLTKLDEQEAALMLSMMQLHEALGQMLDRKAELQEKELVKLEDARTAAFNLQHAYNNSLSLGSRIPASLMMKEPKKEPKCAGCGANGNLIKPKDSPRDRYCIECNDERERYRQLLYGGIND